MLIDLYFMYFTHKRRTRRHDVTFVPRDPAGAGEAGVTSVWVTTTLEEEDCKTIFCEGIWTRILDVKGSVTCLHKLLTEHSPLSPLSWKDPSSN